MSDDDIIELTEIVKQGRLAARPVQDAAPALSAPAASEEEPPLPEEAGVKSVAAQMPDFGADLDALLQNYDHPAAGPAPTVSPPPGEVVPAPIVGEDSSVRPVNPNEELELPPLSDLDALLEELGVQNNVAPDAAATATAVPDKALPGDDLDASPFPVAGQKPAPPAAKIAAPDDDGIDLNELDALLDSVLSTAPKPSAMPAEAPKPAPVRPKAPEAPEASVAQAVASKTPPAPAPVPADPAPVAAEPAPVAAETIQALAEGAAASATLRSEVEGLKAELEDLRANMEKYGTVAALAALRSEVEGLRAELGELRANMEKHAAAAAAKVIREELAVIAANLE